MTDNTHLIPVYPHRLPIHFTRGEGVWLWDDSPKNPYLDALSGRGVCSLGHCHPAVTQTIQTQAAQLLHTSNLYTIPAQAQLATKLCKLLNMSQAFFANSGAEAIEAAIKIAWLQANKQSISSPLILAFQGSYHGRSLGALNASGSLQLRNERLAVNKGPETFIHIPFNDIEALEEAVSLHHSRLVAILVEPIQGDGGIQVGSPEFLQRIRAHCDQYKLLMIADEIQTGLCRTGHWLGCDHAKVIPDIVVLAKALGNGFPIGAYLVRGQAQGLLNGQHGSTFAGNPMACMTALTVIHSLETGNYQSIAHQLGVYLQNQLKNQLMALSPQIREIRGKGLMIGIELKHPPTDVLLKSGLKHKLLFDVVAHQTIRLLPPLMITRAETDEIVQRLQKTLSDYFSLKR